ncbi:MAG: leucine--tRNA ligase [Methanospirillaceae archaeon]|nr:leucine--tRNA ligase [Methanospirillaceae archaeon]
MQRWKETFTAKPSDKEKFYLTVAYPYPSGAMHVGHGRTYIVPDVIARFWRMREKEVLYPMAFHVTGAPVIGISKRIARQDQSAITLYRDLYRVPDDVLATFTDPINIVTYFSREYQRVMTAAGLSIDWSRTFTTIEPAYSKFIEWQWDHLKNAGYVVKGAHPVRYCTQCDNPVGDHDLLEGDTAQIQQFTLVLFSSEEGYIPCATLRPETVYGVTNLWVNPETEYVRIEIDGQIWIVSREAMGKLSLQDHDIKELGTIHGSYLVDRVVHHDLCGDIPILPASFVDPDMATGLVMSVPAHAPYDYIALRDLQQKGKYSTITPVGLIQVDGFGTAPAVEAVESAGITDQNDPRLLELTQQVYSAEHATGKMREKYGGKPVKIAREEVSIILTDRHGSIIMYEFDTRPVVCRCNNRVFVRVLHDQWFLSYSNPQWKEQVHEQLQRMDLVPPEVRAEFDRTVDWLNDWACTRRIGLGTRLPWDPEWLIEPLSDSTVYMAYYTIAAGIKKIDHTLLTPAVFDYIFLGKKQEGLPNPELLDELRREFLYWYPYNYRFSAKDLISNHLTFQIFHHCAIFPRELLPQGMVVFGMGLLNGAKMSSSKGNVYLLEDAINDFGADTVRMFLIGSGEPWQDFDWRNDLVASTKKQIDKFAATIQSCMEADGPVHPVDPWLMSRMQDHVAKGTAAMERFQTRQALYEMFYAVEADLRWYRRRTGSIQGKDASKILGSFASVWLRLVAPIIPYTCEELYQETNEGRLVSTAPWPVVDTSAICTDAELGEELLARTVEDIESILRIIKIKPEELSICIAPEWKWKIFSQVAQSPQNKTLIKEIMQDETMKQRGKETIDTVKQCTSHLHRLPPDLVSSLVQSRLSEYDLFIAAKEFLEREFSLTVTVYKAGECHHSKAQSALPYKPAIIIM